MIDLIYNDCEYEIKIVKTKKDTYSKQEFRAENKIFLKVGIASLLQSSLDAGILEDEKELKAIVDMVLEQRKKGLRNRVVYNGMTDK